jgi:TRAP-type C4-dicarboxylate transport system permease large subunit
VTGWLEREHTRGLDRLRQQVFAAAITVLMVITCVPQLSLWLPTLFGGK